MGTSKLPPRGGLYPEWPRIRTFRTDRRSFSAVPETGMAASEGSQNAVAIYRAEKVCNVRTLGYQCGGVRGLACANRQECKSNPAFFTRWTGKKMYQVIVLIHVKLLVFASRCRLEVLRNQQQQEEER